jgi:hypothetical protein
MVCARGEGSKVELWVEAAEESGTESKCWRDAKSYIRSAAVTLRPGENRAEDAGRGSCVGRARGTSGTARRSALFSRGDDDSDAIRAVRAQAPARVVPVDVPRAAWRREVKRGTRRGRALSRVARVRPTCPFEANKSTRVRHTPFFFPAMRGVRSTLRAQPTLSDIFPLDLLPPNMCCSAAHAWSTRTAACTGLVQQLYRACSQGGLTPNTLRSY